MCLCMDAAVVSLFLAKRCRAMFYANRITKRIMITDTHTERDTWKDQRQPASQSADTKTSTDTFLSESSFYTIDICDARQLHISMTSQLSVHFRAIEKRLK